MAIGRELDDHDGEGGVNDSLGLGFSQEVSRSHHVSSYHSICHCRTSETPSHLNFSTTVLAG